MYGKGLYLVNYRIITFERNNSFVSWVFLDVCSVLFVWWIYSEYLLIIRSFGDSYVIMGYGTSLYHFGRCTLFDYYWFFLEKLTIITELNH